MSHHSTIASSKRTPGPVSVHRISILAEYEGEPIRQEQLDNVIRELGDILVAELLRRHPGADQIFTIGARHDADLTRYT